MGVGGTPLGVEAACPSPSQYEEKDKAFKEQLSHLATLLPTLQVRGAGGTGLGTHPPHPHPAIYRAVSLPQVHLVNCSSFLSLANKAEFLDLGYVSPPGS